MATIIFLTTYGSLALFAVGVCRRIQRPQVRSAAIVTFAILSIPALYVVGGASAAVANNIRLARFAVQLHSFPLPEGAVLVAISRQVGVLTGNGDHCDFIATVQFRSRLPPRAIEAHYAALELKPAIPGGAGGGLPGLTVEPALSSAQQMYLVTLTDAPYEGIFDPRCF